MAKISFTKLGLKKNTNVINLTWNEQIIEIKEYLPIEEKIAIIERIVNQSLDDNNFANPVRVRINAALEIVFAYTNINFTDKQKEDRLALYDLLAGTGLLKAIYDALPSNEYTTMDTTVWEVIDEIYRYKTSVLGILQAVSQDYSNLELDADKIREKLGNKENIEFLKNVMDKLG